jgi:hypothetical protein
MIEKSASISLALATIAIPGQPPSPNLSQIMLDLACLLIPQEILPQSAVLTDTPILREFPCETNILRDIGANL